MAGAINPIDAATPLSVRVVEDSAVFQRMARLVLAGDASGSAEAEAAVQRIIRTRGEGRIPVHAIAAIADGEPITGVLVVESGGDAALVYLPRTGARTRDEQALTAILMELESFGRNRGLSLLQVLISSDSQHARLLKGAGFRYLAELIYLERPASVGFPVLRTAAAFSWRRYDERNHAFFVEALSQSYENSLDCPGLAGIRETPRILEGHKTTGVYDPDGWYLATCGDAVAGVIITAGVELRSALEVVYTGVSPAYRGQGVGDALLSRAVEHARSNRQAHLTLAVDAINTPARRLYERWSFQEIGRRRAWIMDLSAR